MDNIEPKQSLDFVRQIVADDLAAGKHGAQVVTRFPPEPNGYLHIGHAKSICLNFGIAAENENGRCHLRFDDTNPETEENKYVKAIQEDVRWLGFDWGEHLYYASDYFERLYRYAVELIKMDKAYVCDLKDEEIKEYRGTVTEPGKESPFRNRPIKENLHLFARMHAGEFADGACVLRAKIDMTSPNMKMRDPLIYRVRKLSHYRTGDKWCIYPMYDFAHCLSDSLEGITHSICTLEFENNRELYDWILNQLEVECHPQQIEFARLNLSYTIMSKRRLLELVEQKYVSGWDDPRMPTLSGLRRRGYTAAAIRDLCGRVGVAKSESVVDVALLEHCLRQELNKTSARMMAVLRPLKVIIDNYPEDQTEEMEAVNNPEDEAAGKRGVPFSRVLYIERDDFREEPPKKFFRLAPGREVRLRYAYYITCQRVVKDEKTGEVTQLHCTYDPLTRGGWAPDGRKVKATIHWVSAAHAVPAEVRLYDYLFTKEDPANLDQGKDYKDYINSKSLEKLADCRVEPALRQARPGERFQFERLGYFWIA